MVFRLIIPYSALKQTIVVLSTSFPFTLARRRSQQLSFPYSPLHRRVTNKRSFDSSLPNVCFAPRPSFFLKVFPYLTVRLFCLNSLINQCCSNPSYSQSKLPMTYLQCRMYQFTQCSCYQSDNLAITTSKATESSARTLNRPTMPSNNVSKHSTIQLRNPPIYFPCKHSLK